MLTTLVTNTKGGCGKSTIATCLAGAFAQAGFRTVLVDCDRQKSSLRWVYRRPSDLPVVIGLDWSKGVTPLPKKTERLVIDVAGGQKRKQIEELVRRADLVLLPLLPSVFDEDTTRRFLATLDKLKPIRKGTRRVAVIGNRIRVRTKAAQRLDEFLSGIGHQAVTRLRDSQFYPKAALGGLSLFDMGSLRAEDFKQDWRPLLSFIDEITAKLDG